MLKNGKWRLWASCMFLAVMLGIFSNTVPAEAKAGTFKKYYNNVLVKKYGTFKKSQTGTMKSWEDRWMDTTGIIGVSVMDFDMDGTKEMLACIAQPLGNGKNSRIMLKMYENVKGGIKKSSEIPFTPYYNGNQKDTAANGITLSPSQWNEASFIISAVKTGKKCYIMCEERQIWGCFASGSMQDYWMLEYKNNKLQYVRSFTQTAGGSSDFEYTGFSFSNGKLKKSELYYSDSEGLTGHKAKYKDYSQAIKKFFSQSNIQLNKYAAQYQMHEHINKTILSKKNKPTKLFNFCNRLVKSDISAGTYKFKVTASAWNNL